MRTKTGFARRRAHRKMQSQAKGYRMTKRKLVKVVKENLLHAGAYAYNGRKEKKQNFRRLWIIRINGALSDTGIKYSDFIAKLKEKNIDIDRKMMAEMIQDDISAFNKLIELVK